MRKLLRALGLVLVIVLLSGAAFGSFIQFKDTPHYATQPRDLHIASSPERIERGRILVGALCAECHQNPTTQQLTGNDMQIHDFGDIWSRNITQHPTAGIGRWTDGELVYLLR